MYHARFRYEENRFSLMSPSSKARAKEFIARSGPLRDYPCAICGSSSFDQISEVDRYGFRYPTGICRDCGNVQQYQYYSEDDISLLYSTYYRDIYGGQEPAALFAGQQELGRSIFEFATKQSDHEIRTVLEVGTGAGGILDAFREHGMVVKGLDFDERYIAMGRSRGVTINRGGLDSLAADETFDLIIMNHVLEHIVDVKRLMEDISSHLAPGGLFYVEVPSVESVARDYSGNLLGYYQNAHFIHFTQGSFRNLLAVSGYEATQTAGAIRALLRHTGKTAPLTNEYKASRAMIDTLERRYAAPGNQMLVAARRMVGKLLDATGLGYRFRTWRSGTRTG